MGALQAIGRSYRVRKGWYPAVISEALQVTTLVMAGYISVRYDDDTDDIIQMPDATIGVGFSRSVAQRPSCCGYTTDEARVIHRRGRTVVLVDEGHPPAGNQALANEPPERLECGRGNMGQPEAEEHHVVAPVRCPGEDVGVDVVDSGIGNLGPVALQHAGRRVDGR